MKRKLDNDDNVSASDDDNVSASDDDNVAADKQPVSEELVLPPKTDNIAKDTAAGDDAADAKKDAEQTADTTNSSSSDGENNIKVLEEAYQAALAAFKADKTNKDLRRAKTAARRALDEAIAASTDGEQLICRDCSQKFIFTTEQQAKYSERGWTNLPKRCDSCSISHKARTTSSDRRDKLDSSGGKKMCYAFQRGECPHGDRCKFSHDPQHGGKYTEGSIGYKNAVRSRLACYAFQNGKCSYGDKCKFSHDTCTSQADTRMGKYEGGDGKGFVMKKKQKTSSGEGGVDREKDTETKERKEKSLRKKEKGWRNK